MYPIIRLRRNRRKEWLREILAETTLNVQDLILPLFVVEGVNQRQPIKTMPGIYRLSTDQLVETVKRAYDYGIKAVALFPCIDIELKDEKGSEAYNLDNLICRAVRTIKNSGIPIGIICDIALDPYTTHGHDGLLYDNEVDNDKTIDALCQQAITLAKAGADILAPSDMMDGRILAIRKTLDTENFNQINLLAYAAKYASCLYNPFRNTVSIDKIDKSTYHMDIRNSKEAMIEIAEDIKEGADMIIIKPGMPCLDIINTASKTFNINVLAYQVSGEYSMMKFAADNGAIDWQSALIESLICFKRAGASAIFTYAALEVAKILH